MRCAPPTGPQNRAEAETGRERLAFEELLVLLVGLARRRRRCGRGRGRSCAGRAGRARGPLPRLAAVRVHARAGGRDRASSTATSPARRRCSGSSRATSAPARPSSRSTRSSARSSTAIRARSWRRPRRSPSSTSSRSRATSRRSASARACSRARCPRRRTPPPARRVASGEAQLVVGTHALIQEHVAFRSLAVAVVDEQHRFGVEQRRALAGRRRAGPARPPHDGDADSADARADGLRRPRRDRDRPPPRDRKPVDHGAGSRGAERARRTRASARHLEEGRQAYVVCPLVVRVARRSRRARPRPRPSGSGARSCAGFRVGCLHGQLPTAERRAVMDAFTRGELDVLVATTVIEVGVDVPNATIMIVQEADRFGLAQLHQLRGRVGRGAEQSYCLLVSRPREELTETAQRAAPGARRTDGRVRARRGRPRAARRGRAARDAPVRPPRPALREPARDRDADRAREARGSPTCRRRTGRSTAEADAAVRRCGSSRARVRARGSSPRRAATRGRPATGSARRSST